MRTTTLDPSRPLFHYTCDCGHGALLTDPIVRPASELIAPRVIAGQPRIVLAILPFCWFTDLETPNAVGLGLTRETISCDRTRYRWRATAAVRPVPYTLIRSGLPRRVTAALEARSGALPMHWFVHRGPVPVVYDPMAGDEE